MVHEAVKRLENHVGESLSEVLVALLISSLGLLILAGMVSSTYKIVKTNMEIMGTFVNAENVFADPEGESTSKDIKMTIAEGNVEISLGSVSVYKNETLEGKPVYSYKIQNAAAGDENVP